MARVKAVRGPARKPAAPPRPHRFGAHLSIAGGMHHAIEQALRFRMDTVAVFVKNQRQWQAATFKPDDLDRWHALRVTPGFGPVVAHATYLINLASPDRSLYARSRAAFTEELERCQMLGIPYLVVHPGAAGEAPVGQALKRVATALNHIFDRNSSLAVMPLLEVTAGQGTTLGSSFEQLGEIIGHLREPERVGVCVDTCHVFAAGYDIRDPDEYEAMIATVQREVGLDRVRCWHLNDCKGELGSRVDRHEHIGRGQIGSAGFRNLLGDARFHGVPMILETPKGLGPKGREWDRVNLRRLRSIAARAYRDANP
jgi:deoxyribonuclease-4